MCRIILPDIPKANMQIILKFLYTGRLGVNVLNFFSSSPADGQNQLAGLSRFPFSSIPWLIYDKF